MPRAAMWKVWEGQDSRRALVLMPLAACLASPGAAVVPGLRSWLPCRRRRSSRLPDMDHVPDRHTNICNDTAVWGRHLDNCLVGLKHQDNLVLVYRIANGHTDVLDFCFMDAFT